MMAGGLKWLGGSLLMTLTMAASAQTYGCVASSSGTLNFLTYDPVSAAPSATATVTLTCTHTGGGAVGVNWKMELTNGSSNPPCSLSATGRVMRRQPGLDATLGYNVYKNATEEIWGNDVCGTPLTGTLPNISNGQPVQSTIQTMRGVIPAGQQVPSGTYSDTLQLTITF
jgi:spore coat protein U-like protein